MGAEPWSYFVPYEDDIRAALDKLREQEFQAGRFRGAELEPASIEEALENMDADGTASILDIFQVADEPDFFTVVPLAQDKLVELFGTDKPTHELVEHNYDLYEGIERGQGVYMTIYKDGQPSEIFFAGYSFD
jgi:hypothetical protein